MNRSLKLQQAVFRLSVSKWLLTEIISQERQADFIDVVAWRQTADFVSRYFHKGSMIAVEGSIQTNNFTDRDGNKRKSVEVVANQVSFCGSKAESQGANPAFSQPAPSYSTADNSDFEEIVDDDDDLPF